MSSDEVQDKSDDNLPHSANELVENKTDQRTTECVWEVQPERWGYVDVGAKRKGYFLQIEMIDEVLNGIIRPGPGRGNRIYVCRVGEDGIPGRRNNWDKSREV